MIDAPELVRRAMSSTGSKTATELARALKLTSFTAPRNIQRWLDGVSAPDYDNTLRLLEAAGMLDASATGRARDLDEAEVAAAIHEIADVLDRLSLLVGERERPRSARDRRRA